MPNHYHLLLRPLKENAISDFMQKLGGGYTRYFNEKYKRTGVLFEGKYKYVHVGDERYFLHLPYYIHANPLKLKFPKWREGLAVGDVPRAIEFLKKYRWSSFPDYIGHKNFPSVTNRKFLWSMQNGRTDEERAKNYLKDFTAWLKDFDASSLPEEVIH